jgi:hypothetical protein
MITSTASGATLDRIRLHARSNPEGSKLTDGERLHLIYMIGAMNTARQMGADLLESDYRLLIREQLVERGLTADDIAAVFRSHGGSGMIAVVDAIAVHPSLREPYLD